LVFSFETHYLYLLCGISLFAGTECIVEKARGKHDVWNQVLGGCATGAAMQAKSGPQGKSLLQVRFIGM